MYPLPITSVNNNLHPWAWHVAGLCLCHSFWVLAWELITLETLVYSADWGPAQGSIRQISASVCCVDVCGETGWICSVRVLLCTLSRGSPGSQAHSRRGGGEAWGGHWTILSAHWSSLWGAFHAKCFNALAPHITQEAGVIISLSQRQKQRSSKVLVHSYSASKDKAGI